MFVFVREGVSARRAWKILCLAWKRVDKRDHLNLPRTSVDRALNKMRSDDIWRTLEWRRRRMLKPSTPKMKGKEAYVQWNLCSTLSVFQGAFFVVCVVITFSVISLGFCFVQVSGYQLFVSFKCARLDGSWRFLVAKTDIMVSCRTYRKSRLCLENMQSSMDRNNVFVACVTSNVWSREKCRMCDEIVPSMLFKFHKLACRRLKCPSENSTRFGLTCCWGEARSVSREDAHRMLGSVGWRHQRSGASEAAARSKLGITGSFAWIFPEQRKTYLVTTQWRANRSGQKSSRRWGIWWTSSRIWKR